uniref:Si:dkey-17e16.9 n=1 Tax=Cynoglossus semilaevis TaxID=244447 RepID=A0A3P8URG4_CYNSE
MAEYKVEVKTGDQPGAGTWDHILVTIIGDAGESERTNLDNFGRDFKSGKVGTYIIKSSSSLGRLLLLKVEKDPCLTFKDDEWYCSTIKVTTPEGDDILFPCHRWISRGEDVQLRAQQLTDENVSLLLINSNINVYPKFYQVFIDGSLNDLIYPSLFRSLELMFKGNLKSTDTWESLEASSNVLNKKTKVSEYIKKHWMEDEFFGYQFLNGINPTTIKRCTTLPQNFPVREEMVRPFLREGTSLYKEMEKGNIFIYDMRRMDGIPGRDGDNGGPLQSVTPGLCLFYSNPEKQLKPIAIQLHQRPSAQSPIFLPSDSETDWLLAKMFIKSADSMDHKVVHHLLFTHFLVEVYAVAALRCFPAIHPLYKLLIPHFQTTIFMNAAAREIPFGTEALTIVSSIGEAGCMELMRRSLSELTYSFMCFPENIAARGLESVPNFYYRDDGLKVWNIINGFVHEVVKFYYPTDCHVCKDSELQKWIKEIFSYGFLERQSSGIPSSFCCINDLSKFLTMIIFTCTAQHSAVNNGQYDYYSNVYNNSILLRKPPPSTKGQTTMKTILETLPNVGETASFVALARLLSTDLSNFVPLGSYPEERFDDPAILQMIKEFQAELSYLSEEITARNSQMECPYEYMLPSLIENSIAR